MKKSLKTTVLILSLAGLVMAGSGCERRGRAAKKDSPKDAITSTGSGTGTTTVAEKTGEGKTPVEISNEETLLLADAKIDCPIFPNKTGALRTFIDAAETPTAETMAADVEAMNQLRNCLGGDEKVSTPGYGVNAIKKEVLETQETFWVIDGGAMNEKGEEIGDDGKPRTPHSPLLTAFDTEATLAGSNDEAAAKTMKSRIAVLEQNSKRMVDKYSQLDPSTEYGAESTKRPTVGKTLDNFKKLVTACNKATEIVDGYWTVRDGIDRMNPEAAPSTQE